jgi:hypothetical protein
MKKSRFYAESADEQISRAHSSNMHGRRKRWQRLEMLLSALVNTELAKLPDPLPDTDPYLPLEETNEYTKGYQAAAKLAESRIADLGRQLFECQQQQMLQPPVAIPYVPPVPIVENPSDLKQNVHNVVVIHYNKQNDISSVRVVGTLDKPEHINRI